MLNQNRYLRVSNPASVLLVQGYSKKDYIVALHNDDLLIVSENEIQVQ